MGLPRILRRNFQEQSRDEKQKQVQNMLNKLVWQIVANQGGKITIRCSELDRLPVNSALKVNYDAKTHTVTLFSAIRHPSGIIETNPGIIT